MVSVAAGWQLVQLRRPEAAVDWIGLEGLLSGSGAGRRLQDSHDIFDRGRTRIVLEQALITE